MARLLEKRVAELQAENEQLLLDVVVQRAHCRCAAGDAAGLPGDHEGAGDDREGGGMKNPVMDELLEISRSMNRRLEQFQREQAAAIDRLELKVARQNEMLRGLGDVVRRPAVVPQTDLQAA